MKCLRLQSLVLIAIFVCSTLLIDGCSDTPLSVKTSWQKEIGPEGGVIVVSEPQSLLYGMKIEIPAGALAGKATIVVSESGKINDGIWPVGTGRWYPLADMSSSEPFLKNIKITFPIEQLPSSDEELLTGFYLKGGNNTWTAVLPTQINGNQMIVETDHLSLWTWGRVSLDEVELETLLAAIGESFYVDDASELNAAAETRMTPFTSTLDDWTDYANHWQHCDDRQAVADLLHGIIQGAEAEITEYLGTKSVIDACDPVYVCELDHMLLTDEQGRLGKWIETEIRIKFGEAFWSGLPGFGGTAGDVLSTLVCQALMEAQYRGALEHEFGCDYRCIFKNANLNFYVNVVVCNVCYIALFGMDVYENYYPCTP